MEVVIEISDGAYKKLCSCGYVSSDFNIISAIKSGIPLPEHHGDLGDLNAVYNDFRQHYFDNPAVMRCAEIVLGNAPTIIPAMEEPSRTML